VKEVSELERQRNLLSCQTRHGLCNRQLLSTAEAGEVSDAEHQRNILACKTGNGYCDASLLSSSEAKEMLILNISAIYWPVRRAMASAIARY